MRCRAADDPHLPAAASRAGCGLRLVSVWVVIAALVGVSRVFLGAHYPSDVVAGWLLGVLVVYVLGALLGIVDPRPRTTDERPLSSMPEHLRTLAVIVNPIKIDSDAFRTKVTQAARAAGWDDPLWFETTVDDAGASMARAAVAAGADVVVAAGGDGTVRVVCAEMASTGVPVGVVPAGTGNLLARNLGIPLGRDQAIEVILRGQDRAIDLVQIKGDGLATTRFAVMAGMGLDAAIMEGAPDAMKRRMGWSAYVVAGMRHLRYPAVRVTISVDGADPVHRRARTVLVGNVGQPDRGHPAAAGRQDRRRRPRRGGDRAVARRRLVLAALAGAHPTPADRRAAGPVHRPVGRGDGGDVHASPARRRHRRPRNRDPCRGRAGRASRPSPPLTIRLRACPWDRPS